MAFRNSVKATLLLEPDYPRSLADAPPSFDAPAPLAKPPARDETYVASAWHARAEELRAMADALPAKTSRPLVAQIAELYDEFARDAGWAEPEALPPEAPPLPDEPLVPEMPLFAEPPADPPPERLAFPRRPLPLGRSFPRRRA